MAPFSGRSYIFQLSIWLTAEIDTGNLVPNILFCFLLVGLLGFREIPEAPNSQYSLVHGFDSKNNLKSLVDALPD